MRPEEEVRGAFIQKMVNQLGFPSSLLSVEKELVFFAGSNIIKDPHRRLDILQSINTKNGLKPLLLVECKAVPLTKKALQQVLGYNRVIQAPFICLTNGVETHTFWYENKKQQSVPFLPTFRELADSFTGS